MPSTWKEAPLPAMLVTSTPPASVEPKGSAGGSGRLPCLDVNNQEAENEEDGDGNVDVIGGAKDADLIATETILSPRKEASSSRGSSSSSSSDDNGKKISSA